MRKCLTEIKFGSESFLLRIGLPASKFLLKSSEDFLRIGLGNIWAFGVSWNFLGPSRFLSSSALLSCKVKLDDRILNEGLGTSASEFKGRPWINCRGFGIGFAGDPEKYKKFVYNSYEKNLALHNWSILFKWLVW